MSSWNLLVLCHEYPPVGGGAGNSCALLSEQLAAAGHTVTVITMQWDNLPETETICGVRVVRAACGRKRLEMASPWEGLRWARRVWPLVETLHRQQPFDLTCGHFVMPAGIVARQLQQRHHVPYVLLPRGSDVPGYNRERLRWAHWLARPWWRRIVRGAALVLSPSRYLWDLLRQAEPRALGEVIPNSVRLGFSPGHKERRLLLCSRLVERKGLQWVLQALVDGNWPGWEVDIVGTGPCEPALREIAARVSIPVHFHGWINNRDPRLRELYARAAVFALPSEAENCPVSLLEAMSAGCAVLTTNVTGNPEVVGDTGQQVPPRNSQAIRQVFEQWLPDLDLCQAKGTAARERALQLFSPDVLLQKHQAVLARLLTPAEVRT